MSELSELKYPVESPEEQALKNIIETNILKKMHSFKEPYREVMYLRLLGGLSFKEIGNILDKSENWARVTFYRGKGIENDEK